MRADTERCVVDGDSIDSSDSTDALESSGAQGRVMFIVDGESSDQARVRLMVDERVAPESSASALDQALVISMEDSDAAADTRRTGHACVSCIVSVSSSLAVASDECVVSLSIESSMVSVDCVVSASVGAPASADHACVSSMVLPRDASGDSLSLSLIQI